MRIWGVGAALLASAFAPLLVVLALVQQPFGGGPGDAVLVVGCALLLLVPAGVLRALRTVQQVTVTSVAVRRRDADVLAFVGSYLVPVAIASFAGDDRGRLAGIGVLLLVLAVVYVRGQLFHLNPVLAMMGYGLYEVTRDSEEVVMVLTRRRHVPQRGELRGVRLADGVLVELAGR